MKVFLVKIPLLWIRLKGVDFVVQEGRVNVLLGEHGAGKSTLMKILSGVFRQDTGKIFINGQECSFHGPIDSEKAGVGIVYQELTVLPI